MARRGENIRKRADGRWEGRYVVQNSDGKRKYLSVYAKSYSEIKQKLAVAKYENNHETEVQSFSIETKAVQKKLPYDVVAEKWLDNVKTERKYSTYVKYRNLYEVYIKPVLLENHPEQSDRTIIRIQEQNLSNSTQKSIVTVSRQLGNYAAAYGLPEIQISMNMHMRKNNPMTQVFNASEQSRLFHFLYTDMDISKMGIVLCLSTGIRLGELCALRWEDVDFVTKTLHIRRTVQRISVDGEKTKTMLLITLPKSMYSIREIPLSDSMLLLLENFYKEDSVKEYIFGRHKPLEPRTYENRFHKYLSELQISNKNFHVLRHTFATNCVCSGADIKSLSEILGHSDVKITLNRYVHPSLEVKRQQLNSLSAIYGQYLGQ